MASLRVSQNIVQPEFLTVPTKNDSFLVGTRTLALSTGASVSDILAWTTYLQFSHRLLSVYVVAL